MPGFRIVRQSTRITALGALCLCLGLIMTAPAMAETTGTPVAEVLPTRYDPVERAIRAGWTPQDHDARFDLARSGAEACGIAPLGETLGCGAPAATEPAVPAS